MNLSLVEQPLRLNCGIIPYHSSPHQETATCDNLGLIFGSRDEFVQVHKGLGSVFSPLWLLMLLIVV